MVCLVKRRGQFYKKVLQDIWSYHLMYRKASKAAGFFRTMKVQRRLRKRHYRGELRFSYRRRIRFRYAKKLKRKYINKRLLYNHYLMIPRRHFRKMHKKASRQLGDYVGNYLALLEGKLFMILFRANFVTNIFSLKTIVDRGLFMVNGKRRSYVNFQVKPGDFVTVRKAYRRLLLYDLYLRFIQRVILGRPPYHLMVSYQFMYIFFGIKPRSKEDIPYQFEKMNAFGGIVAYFL